MARLPANEITMPERIAALLLVLFLVAVLLALAITLYSVSIGARVIALSAVTPIVVLTLLFLYLERSRRPWSFIGGGVLGAFGVALRLTISTQPQLEVGEGLPVWVTATYLTLGLSVIVGSAWAYRTIRRAHPELALSVS
jgi:hypothetical protein